MAIRALVAVESVCLPAVPAAKEERVSDYAGFRCLMHSKGRARPLAFALAVAFAGPERAAAQPDGEFCFPPVPPETPAQIGRRAFELAADAYFDEVSRFYACNSSREQRLEAELSAELAAEIENLRGVYAQIERDERRMLDADRAAVRRDYERVLEIYRRGN
jgi:hypothetical protein